MVVSFAPLRARVYMIGTFEKTRNSCRSLGHRSSAGDRRLHNPQLVLRFPASQEAHVGNASSSSSPRSTTTSTPLSTEYGTNWAKSRTLVTLNVSNSRFPSSLKEQFRCESGNHDVRFRPILYVRKETFWFHVVVDDKGYP